MITTPQERMAIFDRLPKDLQNVANEHGLNRALKLQREQEMRKLPEFAHMFTDAG